MPMQDRDPKPDASLDPSYARRRDHDGGHPARAGLDVQLPNRDYVRATRRVAIELSTSPHIQIGSEVPVRVDPQDRSKVLVVASP